ncbi:hypothetical protein STHU_40360 [Allostella humosa]|nr:hypothetical protein STHU_40360 [Stella humosa]
MTMDSAARQREMERITAKAWLDDTFKAKLLTDANMALAEEGIEVPAGITIKVVENTPSTLHFVLPTKPHDGELSEEELADATAGGYCGVTMG